MSKAKKAGIRVPEIYYYDKKNCALHMEFLDLPTVKSVIIKYYDKKSKKYDNSKCKFSGSCLISWCFMDPGWPDNCRQPVLTAVYKPICKLMLI